MSEILIFELTISQLLQAWAWEDRVNLVPTWFSFDLLTLISALYFKTRVWPSSYLSITLSYNNNTRVATALLLTREDGQTSLQFARHFQNNQQWCCQPLLAPLLLIEIALDDCHRLLSSHTDHLNDLQDEVGQREYGDRPIANPLSIDFVATTRKLNSSGRSFASIVATLQSFKMVLEKMVEFRKDLLLDKDEGEQDSEGMISNKIGYLFDTCRVLLTHAEYDGKRIAFLIQVVSDALLQFPVSIDPKLSGLPIHGPKRRTSQHRAGRDLSSHRQVQQRRFRCHESHSHGKQKRQFGDEDYCCPGNGVLAWHFCCCKFQIFTCCFRLCSVLEWKDGLANEHC